MAQTERAPRPADEEAALKKLGSAVKSLRLQRGLNQEELAALIHSHRVTVAKLETGAYKPSWPMLGALAKCFKMSTIDLMNYVYGEPR